jgi:hypothetical protein
VTHPTPVDPSRAGGATAARGGADEERSVATIAEVQAAECRVRRRSMLPAATPSVSLTAEVRLPALTNEVEALRRVRAVDELRP